jgi:hypothetical protein
MPTCSLGSLRGNKVPCDVLSAFLTFCGRVVYAFYASEPESGSPHRDFEAVWQRSGAPVD